MSSTTAAQAVSSLNSNSANIRDNKPISTDERVIASLANSSTGKSDSIDVSLAEAYKSLTVLGDEIISKLDELLKDQLPEGLRSLKPEDHTAEATANRIADSVTALLPMFARQNPELKGEALVDKFLEEVRGGIKEGFGQAVEILEGLGAFEFEGVREGIDRTMVLVDEKLNAFRTNFLKAHEPPKVEEQKVEQAVSEVPPAAFELEQRLAVNA